jgi:predicted nuclease with RNAse H fold
MPKVKLQFSDFVIAPSPVILTIAGPPFTVIGIDPTAGTWESRMIEGPKRMPSFALHWDGSAFHPTEKPLQWHPTNQSFWQRVDEVGAALSCIDGPCRTNGPCLLSDDSGWEKRGKSGLRVGELELSRQGINLFWTTQNTVEKFDGASRWIARSLKLFSEDGRAKIETHPHGAFTFLWRLFGGLGPLPKKKKRIGRDSRLALLKAFVPTLTLEMVPDDDAMDAACAALVAGFHQMGLTKAFGDDTNGGKIWMPDIEKLRAYLPPPGEAPSV